MNLIAWRLGQVRLARRRVFDLNFFSFVYDFSRPTSVPLFFSLPILSRG